MSKINTNKLKYSREKQTELLYKSLRKMAKTSVKGIDGEEFGEFLVECYQARMTPYYIERAVQDKYNVDKETSHLMVHTVTKKANVITGWIIAKSRGATHFYFDSPYDDRYDGRLFPIEDFLDYMEFMVETYASPTFTKK